VKRGAVLFVLSVLPGGGFVAERMLAKEERAGWDQPRLAIASLSVFDGRITAAALAGSGWK
ncbi:hypothetical protein ACFC0A_25950, partial [Kitasatospora purpeofusca]